MINIVDYIKHTLRGNSFYKQFLQGKVNAIRYSIKDVKEYLRYYSIRKDFEVSGNTVYFVFDPSRNHPGMTDRVKVIVCCYWIAKINGFDFKIIYDQPHRLSDYLSENLVAWKADRSELSYSLQNSRLLSYNGSLKVPHLSKHVKQYHIYNYIGINILLYNQVPDAERIWTDCFNELFMPSPRLAEAFAATGLVPGHYISAHLRFVNALEHFEEGYYNSLSSKEQNTLIEKCLSVLKTIQMANEDLPLYVFSDSRRFLIIAKETGYHCLDGQIGHVSFVNDENTLLKTFLDLYAISQSAKVFRVLGGPLYDSTFSYYAALMGGKQGQKIQIL